MERLEDFLQKKSGILTRYEPMQHRFTTISTKGAAIWKGDNPRSRFELSICCIVRGLIPKGKILSFLVLDPSKCSSRVLFSMHHQEARECRLLQKRRQYLQRDDDFFQAINITTKLEPLYL